jgi:hypothetical protein
VKLDLYKGLTWIFGLIITVTILVHVWNSYELAPEPAEPLGVFSYCVNQAVDDTISHRYWCGQINDRNVSCLHDVDNNVYVSSCIAEYEQATKAYNSYHWWANIRGKE